MPDLSKLVGSTDIYLLDQIIKGRYQPDDVILDAGCGSGRNLTWFVQNHISIFGIDQRPESIKEIQGRNPQIAGRFTVIDLEKIPFLDDHFDHLISSAVLHFCRGLDHFHHLFSEHIRVLKPGGSFFIRMTSNIGIEKKIMPVGNGVYIIPDGSRRFLLTREMAGDLRDQYNLQFLEPLKTTNVNDVRCMSTLVLKKT